MLAALRIESLAIIESLEVRFDRGLNVLTGETGAGKSILIDALQLLLGGRADPGVIRSGCEEAAVEGLFVGAGLAEKARAFGLPAEGDEILIRRTVTRGGRGRVHVNGALATVSLLATLTRGLVDLSGQHEHVSLLRRDRHLDLLDDFGGLGRLRHEYEASYATLAASIAERESLVERGAEAERRRDFLSFQLAEIDEIDPRPGEEERLVEERGILSGAERLRAAAMEAEEALSSGEGALVDRLATVARRVEEAAKADPRLAPMAEAVAAARSELDEAARSLGRYASSIEGDPERLALVEERVEAVRHLARKYGGSVDSVRLRADEMREELRRIETGEQRLAELDVEIRERSETAAALAARLSAGRREAATGLGLAVGSQFAGLGLEGARLEVRLTLVDEGDGPGGTIRLGRRGAEDAEFHFGPNPGEEAAPLARIASGGELSRVLLALKRALAHVDPVESYVFDEIDAGIGGATGLVVGEMLRDVARDRQVLCVTHLPQVAAFADVHLHVTKAVRGGRTRSNVERLDAEAERTRSLARMLSGGDGPAALAAAEELLSKAGKGRRRSGGSRPRSGGDGAGAKRTRRRLAA